MRVFIGAPRIPRGWWCACRSQEPSASFDVSVAAVGLASVAPLGEHDSGPQAPAPHVPIPTSSTTGPTPGCWCSRARATGPPPQHRLRASASSRNSRRRRLDRTDRLSQNTPLPTGTVASVFGAVNGQTCGENSVCRRPVESGVILVASFRRKMSATRKCGQASSSVPSQNRCCVFESGRVHERQRARRSAWRPTIRLRPRGPISAQHHL
jgi:hypothetical protein